ncbi:hypothetical protein Bbelb_273750 [Branchiostoma belcheri]|nr:hypothetical protein Bbelb_273750 [Branchiostoma belcheri]
MWCYNQFHTFLTIFVGQILPQRPVLFNRVNGLPKSGDILVTSTLAFRTNIFQHMPHLDPTTIPQVPPEGPMGIARLDTEPPFHQDGALAALSLRPEIGRSAERASRDPSQGRHESAMSAVTSATTHPIAVAERARRESAVRWNGEPRTVPIRQTWLTAAKRYHREPAAQRASLTVTLVFRRLSETCHVASLKCDVNTHPRRGPTLSTRYL